MKTRLSLVLGALLLGGSSYAQEGTVKIGAALLPQSTWLLNQDDSDAGPNLDYQTTWGFAGGLTVAYHFTDYLGVGLDVLYSSQGQKYKGTESGTNLSAQTTLNYLKLPLLFRFNSDPNSPVQFSFFAGPQANLLLSYTDKAEVTGGGITWTFETQNQEKTTTFSGPGTTFTDKTSLTAKAYKPLTLGAVVGLGAGFKLTEELLLGVHVRLDYIFGDVENKDCKVNHPLAGVGATHQDPYWEVKPRYNFSSTGAPAGYTRPSTQALTGGLMLSLTYALPMR